MKKHFAFATLVLFIASAQQAYAYIDPGSGSVLMSAILGFTAAIAYTARKYFYKLKNIFSKSDLVEPEEESEDNGK